MINKIIDGICEALDSEFGYEIYTETIEQGLQEPCFSVLCLNPTVGQVLGDRYFRTNQFCVHYFPESNKKRSECSSAMERLFNVLELITVDGDLVRGTEMHGEIDDGVLHFFVNYDMYVYKETEERPVMASYSHHTDMKG
jgi:hypothetical protein